MTTTPLSRSKIGEQFCILDSVLFPAEMGNLGRQEEGKGRRKRRKERGFLPAEASQCQEQDQPEEKGGGGKEGEKMSRILSLLPFSLSSELYLSYDPLSALWAGPFTLPPCAAVHTKEADYYLYYSAKNVPVLPLAIIWSCCSFRSLGIL